MQEKEKNYISEEGFKKLTEELEHLLKVERPNLTKMITWAASNGDRSENADYIYGKRKLREIDRRLRFLRKRIEIAEVVKLQEANSGKAQFGAKVTVLDEDDQIKTYEIVGVDEIELLQKKISWKSPLGASLLGREVGEVVTFKTPKGMMELEILRIEYK